MWIPWTGFSSISYWKSVCVNIGFPCLAGTAAAALPRHNGTIELHMQTTLLITALQLI